VKTIPDQLSSQPMGLGNLSPVEDIAPLALVNVRRDAQAGKRGPVRQICQQSTLDPQLRNKRRMLDKALIIFSPGGGKFARSIYCRSADRVPPPAEACSTVA